MRPNVCGCENFAALRICTANRDGQEVIGADSEFHELLLDAFMK
jgi:hypothetical protein